MMSQKPLNTPWTPFSTAVDVGSNFDLSGKVAIVTGGASGLGLETSRVLVSLGARVIVGARSSQAPEALSALPNLEFARLDLFDQQSVQQFVGEFVAREAKLDLLILNAGIMATALQRDACGNEGQFATNHLGHFRLTAGLWPALRAAEEARIVSLSSRGHQISEVDFTDLAFKRREYNKWIAYGQSKTANALFAVAANARGERDDIRAYSVHPGSIVSPLARHLTKDEIAGFGAVDDEGAAIIDPAADKKTIAQGAATTIWCATSPLLRKIGGVYCENSDIASIETERRSGVRPYAVDRQKAELLWKTSVDLTGIDIE
jgi:NAD(P)-dependent dehydrogenase (short-subunit alcohol dehydrogenase family)